MKIIKLKKITITSSKRRITVEKLIEICKKEVHEFDKKYLVYKNFRDKGYIINPGIKFGCDFAVYEKGPGIDHAPFLIQVYNRSDSISSTAIVLAGRLATTVRKQFILAIPKGKDKVDFLALTGGRPRLFLCDLQCGHKSKRVLLIFQSQCDFSTCF